MTHQDDFLKLKGDITFHLEALLIHEQVLHQKEKQLKKLRQQHNSNSRNPRSCDPFQGQNILVSQRSGHDTNIGPPWTEETEPSKLIESIAVTKLAVETCCTGLKNHLQQLKKHLTEKRRKQRKSKLSKVIYQIFGSGKTKYEPVYNVPGDVLPGQFIMEHPLINDKEFKSSSGRKQGLGTHANVSE